MALRCSSGVPQCNRVTRMTVETIALLSKQTNFPTRSAPWRHLSGNRVLFAPHYQTNKTIQKRTVVELNTFDSLSIGIKLYMHYKYRSSSLVKKSIDVKMPVCAITFESLANSLKTL